MRRAAQAQRDAGAMAEMARACDPLLLRTLELAIEANNVEVLDQLLGIRHPKG